MEDETTSLQEDIKLWTLVLHEKTGVEHTTEETPTIPWPPKPTSTDGDNMSI